MGGNMEQCFKQLFLENTNSSDTKIEFAEKNSKKEILHLSGPFDNIKLLNFQIDINQLIISFYFNFVN